MGEVAEAIAELSEYIGEAGAEATEGSSEAAANNVSIESPAAVVDKKEKAQQASKKKSKFGNVVQKTGDIVDTAKGTVPSMDSFPTGGVGFLLFIILLIVFAIVPAYQGANRSRLSLLWQAILGNASLGDKQSSGYNAGDSYATGGTFNPNSPPAVGSDSPLWGNQWGGGFY